MRHPSSVLRYFVLVLVLGFAARGYADDRTEARAHYQAGVKYYSGGDYRSAIREFSAAQQSAPADLNNYNLALCYDKLGDAEPAIQYYRAFLDKQPNTDKRAEIEASIDRLDAAARSAASKKAGDAHKVDDAKPPAGPAFGPAPAPDAIVAPPISGPAPDPAVGSTPAPGVASPERHKSGPAIQGTLDPSSSTPPGPTGDPQLDHINSIDIDQIRDQRGIGGAPEAHSGPAVAAATAGATPAAPAASAGAIPPASNDQPKKETAIYKKWWFWAVVAVSGVVVYNLATSSSSSSSTRTRGTGNAPGGLTLLSW